MNTQSIGIQLFANLLHADLITKIIMFVLLFFSVYSWAIIFEKIFKFKILSIKTSKFEKMFWSGDMMEEIYNKVRNTIKCPIVVVFSSAVQEWLNSNIQEVVKNNNEYAKDAIKTRLYDVMIIAINRSIKKLKTGLNFLLIVSSTSTLIGLFGTVWGISASFKAIALVKEATLVTIAPGINAALITTIMGLIAAIPSLIAYYIIKAKIANHEEELNDFSLEILNILSRELD